MQNISRRKFISISTVALSLSFLPSSLQANAKKISWEGKALGAHANINLYHTDEVYAKSIIKECINEIKRLENIFSLFRRDSSIVKLNKNGFLNKPPKELVELLTFSNKISKLSNGAFDVTVQPLWNLHSKYYSKNKSFESKKFQEDLKKTKKRVGFDKISINSKKIQFKEKDMSITLNGIAQGFITDKITELLRQKGFKNALINLGEIRGLGKHDNGQTWKIGFSKENTSSAFPNYIELKNKAIATSGGYGTKFGDNYHHLFNPKTGTSANFVKSVTILAPTATLADALSTTIAVMPKKEAKKLLKRFNNIDSYIV